MNKKLIHIASFMAILSLFSCDDYLKEDSADLLIPESVTDFTPLLLGEGYPDKFGSQISFVNLMTDDVEMGPLYYDAEQKNDRYCTTWREGIDAKAGYGEAAFVWQSDFSENIRDGFWSGRYSNILGCNTIINALPEMTYAETEEGLYRALAAQAYALRAYHYFCLINTYALPYSTANLDKPGVVIKTSPEIQIAPQPRATIREVYALINDDIKKAQEYMTGAVFQCEKYNGRKPEITSAAIYFLAARIALFQQDWDGVISAAEKFLAKNSSIHDLNTEEATLFGFVSSFEKASFCVNNQELDEVVFGFGRSDGGYDYLAPNNPVLMYYEYGFHTSWTGENSLIGLYDEDDLRLQAYFQRRYNKSGSTRNPTYYAGQYHPHKYDQRSGTNYSSQAWRTPELYLNLAEAYAQKASGVSNDAIGLLNQLRVKKYKSGSPDAEKQVSDFATKDDLIQFIWQERRRELCFEEIIRFWDMRRQGMPAVEHRLFSSPKEYSVYRLKAESPNYVLPIPEDETSYNNAIENNRREVIASSSQGTLE